jgi:glycerol kinase
VKPSCGIFGEVDARFFERKIPIAAVIGDQQASLFGQAAFKKGMAKNTYGTGCFLLANTGSRITNPHQGLISTIAWSLGKNRVTYALEGSILVAGAAIQWLVDGLQIMRKISNFNKTAGRAANNGGLYFVPALTGLGSPFWDSEARGLMIGITRGTTKEHVVRAALEGICYQTKDVFGAIEDGIGHKIKVLRADGGVSKSNVLMQFQADILGVPVQRAMIKESTSYGAACMAGLAMGKWRNLEDIAKSWRFDREFVPKMTSSLRNRMYLRWKEAVSRSLHWAS